MAHQFQQGGLYLAGPGGDRQDNSRSSLPVEMWIQVLSFLDSQDLAKALCTCHGMSAISQDAWKAACYRKWPKWSSIAAEPNAQWRRVYEMLALRQVEVARLPDVRAARRLQTLVTDRHRSILAEWLCEVSFDWTLESSIVFKAVNYLDHYLASCHLDNLARFQLLGVACLRAAMTDTARPLASPESDQKALDPRRFAHISADTYTAEDVVSMTQVIFCFAL